MTAHTISLAGLALIQDYEGFQTASLALPDGRWVVGYSHVRVEAGEALSEAEAVNLLKLDLAAFERLVSERVTQPLAQSQFDALVSFAFSIGAVAFVQSQVLRRVNAGEFVAAACAMDAWRKSEVAGELAVVDALVRRRAAEKAMFLKDLPQLAAPSTLMRAKLDYAASVLGAPVRYASPPAASAPFPQAAPVQVETAQMQTDASPLLLTQVVDAEEDPLADSAKLAVSRIEVHAELPIDRRIRSKRLDMSAGGETPKFAWSFEALASGALIVLAVALIALGASIAAERTNTAFSVLGAIALCGAGVAAAVLALFSLRRSSKAEPA